MGISEHHGVCLLELDRSIRPAVDVQFLRASLSIRSLDHGGVERIATDAGCRRQKIAHGGVASPHEVESGSWDSHASLHLVHQRASMGAVQQLASTESAAVGEHRECSSWRVHIVQQLASTKSTAAADVIRRW